MTFGFGPIEKVKLYKAPHVCAKERTPSSRETWIFRNARALPQQRGAKVKTALPRLFATSEADTHGQ